MLNVAALVTAAAAVLAWEGVIELTGRQFEYLPAPSAIALALADLLRSGALIGDLLHTLRAVVLGWGIATLLGVAAGLILGFSAAARRYSMASVDVLRSIPAIAFVPVGVLVFGFSLKMELLAIVYASLWPILVNTIGGVTGAPRRLHDVARTLRLSSRSTVAKVLLPAAAPPIIVGCRLGMGIALVLAIIAEMVGNPEGLGYAIVREQQALQPANMFAYLVTVGFLGMTLNSAVIALGRLAFPGWAARLQDAR
jgi:ABC-type nitrate/sulfonate/bicarbonate transport system permease component